VWRLNEIVTGGLLRFLGDWLAAVCVLAAVFGGCQSPPAPTGSRPGSVSGPSSAEPSGPSAPRFVAGGPDTSEYSASEGYPIGGRSTYFRIPFLVGSHSHLDQVFEGRVIGRAATPSRLARAGGEPALRYEFGGETRTLDDYLARNPATGLLGRARGHDPRRALPVWPERSASLHLVVDGQDRHLHAGRHRDRGRPHPLGG
jgi:hypothetical protein